MERLSWVVAIVGLPFGVYQVIALRSEQRRIGQELSRQPNVTVGFFPIGESHGMKTLPQDVDIMATWPPGLQQSRPLDLTIVCHNSGQRSAHNLVYNFTFMPQVSTVSFDKGSYITNPQDGRRIWAIREDHLNPEDWTTFTAVIMIPAGAPVITISAEISMDDRPVLKVDMRAHVVQAPPPQSATALTG